MVLPVLYKWDFIARRYEEIPNTLRIAFPFDAFGATICANCKRPMMIEDGYTSKQWHTKSGFGYIVCEDCYSKEWHMRQAYPYDD